MSDATDLVDRQAVRQRAFRAGDASIEAAVSARRHICGMPSMAFSTCCRLAKTVSSGGIADPRSKASTNSAG